MNYFAKFPKSRAIRDIPFFVAGGFIGWQVDVTSNIEGLSMYPTLMPRDRILHVPVKLRRWWLDLRGAERYSLDDENRLVGKVVVAKVDKDLTVCKRVHRASNDPHVIASWAVGHFRDGSDLHEEDFADNDNVRQCAGSSSESAATSCASLTADVEVTSGDAGALAGAPICAASEPPLGDDSMDLPEELPYRRHDWDWCIEDKAAAATQWLWVEGDNSHESFDSRNCGPIPLECVRGVVVWKLWPELHRVV